MIWREADLRTLAPGALEGLFGWLRADALPVGTFTGVAWSQDVPRFARFVSRVWQGKEFSPQWPTYPPTGTVMNRIAGRRLVRGAVTLADQTVRIHYPRLHLTDELKPLGPGRWLGRLAVRGHVIWFLLEKEHGE